MLLFSVSKKFLKKLISIVAVVGVVLGCLGLAYKQESKAQAEYRKRLEHFNEEYKNYKNGKEYVNEQLNNIVKSTKEMICKCIERDENGDPIFSHDVKDISVDKNAKDQYDENFDFEISKNIDSVKNTIGWKVEPLDNGGKMIEFVLVRFDSDNQSLHEDKKKFFLNEDKLNRIYTEDMTYGDYLDKLLSRSKETITEYDDMVKMHDEYIRILEAYGLRNNDNPVEDIDDVQIEDRVPALLPALSK